MGIVEIIVGPDSEAFQMISLVGGNNHPTEDNFFMEFKLHILVGSPLHHTKCKEQSRALCLSINY